ncbi:CDP-alcohol phosphatidyltransferase family protein [Sulfoacidibacillus thermotolerans]|uniref:CDP-alcohol phosphatidyltransferase n=1 Tax=Sulfoacidibacillus thermotolerans TaxID=1765684 RepID=A0A2U3D8Q1_SULT2|nr:CDP-alcohol phosphatidyltransferase family protein [Sulfoacidibacillus thermotolerans]PWI57664.1 hypothetical protein BM613_07695 [Sulfoacidibacillus thermotolerans]
MSEFKAINASAKRPVDIWTNYGYYFFSLRFVYLIRKTNITPNQVTLFSFFLLLFAAWLFSRGTRNAILFGVLIHQLSFVFDCADGQLARYKQQFSPYGAWLDQIADRIKEYVLALAFAYGYSRFHPGIAVWEYALAELFLLFLLEYYEQQRGKIGKTSAPITNQQTPDDHKKKQSESGFYQALRNMRSRIPFRGFTIGEQYFLTGILLLFTNEKDTLIGITYVALIMAIYHPLATITKRRFES